MDKNKNLKIIKDHLEKTGFIFPNSKIYGGLANAYDYGPLGTLFIKNIKDLWWREFITKEPNNYGLDAKTLLKPSILFASGHTVNFIDLLVENKINQKRYRADHIINEIDPSINPSTMSHEEIRLFLQEKVKKYDGSKTEWGQLRNFNLMFETYQGVIDNPKNDKEKSKIYLRPELAQGIFMNYKNVMKSMRAKIPFGIGQIGHSFRNEVTPRNFIFRTREFEQMELEYFVKPDDDEISFNYYEHKIKTFLELLGLNANKKLLRFRIQTKNELAHYAKKTVDVEYNFPFGWGEIIGLANRGDFDLKNHSGVTNMLYKDPDTETEYIPYVIEPSIGVDRLALALLVDAFPNQEIKHNERLVLKINPKIAPYKVAVLPLIKNLHYKKAQEIYLFLINNNISSTYDQSGATIGKRYYRQDEIGTPWCMTIDDKTLENNLVTLRHRDTTKQITINYFDFIKKNMINDF